MAQSEIRWKQRFRHYKTALSQLQSAVHLAATRPLTELERQGTIQAFEFTHELAWNVIKDYFQHQGNTSITGSRDAAREAFQRNLIQDGDGWMEMIKSRNQTTHTYNQLIANEIVDKILTLYARLFDDFKHTMQGLDVD